MANFIAISDPDQKRRLEFIQKVSERIAPVDGLSIGGCSFGDLEIKWAANPRAPISYEVSETECVTVFGTPITKGGTFLDAVGLSSYWNRDSAPSEFPYFNGFYAALSYSADGRLVVGADILGLFPIYYWQQDDVFIVSSSVHLLSFHPLFPARFNPSGLVGILLTGHMFDGETLFQGVRRLEAGHILVHGPHGNTQEVETYRIPVSTRYFDLPLDKQAAVLWKHLQNATERNVRHEQAHGLLLSGGRDSRMLAGLLALQGVETHALSFGLGDESDLWCATQVAQRLGFRHSRHSISQQDYPAYAETTLNCWGLDNGFNIISGWGILPALHQLPPLLVSGYVMDAVVGPGCIGAGYSDAEESLSFERFFRSVNAWAISADNLRNLLRQDVFHGLLDECMAKIRQCYESYAEFESQKIWRFDLDHRQRFHTGRALWVASFSSWPIVPALDSEVIATVAGLPAAALANRRIQDEIFRAYLPKLAELPLDRGSAKKNYPIHVGLRGQLDYLRREIMRTMHISIMRSLGNRQYGKENYFTKLLNLNGPGWRSIRKIADQHRESVYQIFDQQTLNELLPPADEIIQYSDNLIVEGSGHKLLLGSILWADKWIAKQ